MSEVYYRVYNHHESGPCIVCMQDFDEFDYTQENFLTKEKFKTEEEARLWFNSQLDKWFKLICKMNLTLAPTYL